MRIAIRDQLGALVLLCTLLALAIIATASWTNNYGFVYQTRTQRLSLVATLKADQLATVLTLYEANARALATRMRVQEALAAYNAGNLSDSSWTIPRLDLEGALESNGGDITGLQCAFTSRLGSANSPSLGLLNATGSGARIDLPWTLPNGTNVTLGAPMNGYPGPLYPNITMQQDTPHYANQPLYANSSILLGPLHINSTLSLISITIPVLQNTNMSNILAWITVVFNASLMMRSAQARRGLGDTGTLLLVGPAEPNHRFPGDLTYASYPIPADNSDLSNFPLEFFWPPDESTYKAKRHSDFAAIGTTFTFSQYPAMSSAFVQSEDTVNGAGTDLSTTNEQGRAVSIGYAILPTSLATLLVVIEYDKEEVWGPVYSLRNVLLGCVFGTAVGMLLFIWPLAHFASRPIHRLGLATKHSVEAPRATDRQRASGDSSADAHVTATSKIEVHSSPKPHDKRSLLVRLRSLGHSDTVNDLELANVTRGFRIPSRVKQRRTIIHDELTDLTATFNAMSDELHKQYSILEDRVRERTEQLEISKQAAEAANESKTLFIANISHELKTPLNGILGMCAVCMQETDPEKIRRSLAIIYRSGDLLHNLLTDLLTFSKNEVGRQQLTLDEKRFVAQDIAVQLRAIFDNQAAENQINLDIMFHGPCDRLGNNDATKRGDYGPSGTGMVKNLNLWGDFHRILQVVINLVSNSLKFTPAGGKVTLTIRCGYLQEHAPSLHISRKSSMTSPSPRMQKLSRSLQGKKKTSEGHSLALAPAHPAMVSVSGSEDGWRPPSSLAESDKTGIPPADAPLIWFDFEVQDTGPGIPSHLQQKIFEPFVQADTRLTKKYGGTGLGLSICSQLSKLMSGSISLESQPGHGSKFTLRIPLRLAPQTISHKVSHSSLTNEEIRDDFSGQAVSSGTEPSSLNKDPPERSNSVHFDADQKPRLVGLSQPFFATSNPPLATPTTANESSSRNRRLRILVAEDNAVNQEVVLRMLRLEDIEDVAVAKDGQEAYDLVKRNMGSDEVPFDLILMDIMMPVKDGKSSTRMIREAGCTTPIVALTAFADEANQRECLESGMNYFLAKPIRRPALKKVLRTYCAPIQEVSESDAGLDATLDATSALMTAKEGLV